MPASSCASPSASICCGTLRGTEFMTYCTAAPRPASRIGAAVAATPAAFAKKFTFKMFKKFIFKTFTFALFAVLTAAIAFGSPAFAHPYAAAPAAPSRRRRRSPNRLRKPSKHLRRLPLLLPLNNNRQRPAAGPGRRPRATGAKRSAAGAAHHLRALDQVLPQGPAWPTHRP